jgi:hypothetical protein
MHSLPSITCPAAPGGTAAGLVGGVGQLVRGPLPALSWGCCPLLRRSGSRRDRNASPISSSDVVIGVTSLVHGALLVRANTDDLGPIDLALTKLWTKGLAHHMESVHGASSRGDTRSGAWIPYWIRSSRLCANPWQPAKEPSWASTPIRPICRAMRWWQIRHLLASNLC